jgi:Protein of unknown function (DUF2796)
MSHTPHRVRRLSTAVALAALVAHTAAGPAHEHGVARLQVAVSSSGITIHLESALENLVGFERAPRSAAERAAVAAALQKLNDAATLFRVDSAAACAGGQSTVQAPLWQPASPPAAAVVSAVAGAAPAATAAPPSKAPAATEHADLDASYEFKCATAPRAQHIETRLFEAFPRLKRVEVQRVTARGQGKVVLRPGQTRLPLQP